MKSAKIFKNPKISVLLLILTVIYTMSGALVYSGVLDFPWKLIKIKEEIL